MGALLRQLRFDCLGDAEGMLLGTIACSCVFLMSPLSIWREPTLFLQFVSILDLFCLHSCVTSFSGHAHFKPIFILILILILVLILYFVLMLRLRLLRARVHLHFHANTHIHSHAEKPLLLNSRVHTSSASTGVPGSAFSLRFLGIRLAEDRPFHPACRRRYWLTCMLLLCARRSHQRLSASPTPTPPTLCRRRTARTKTAV